MPVKRNSLAEPLERLTPQEGMNTGPYPGVQLWRLSVAEKATPNLYPASIIFVGQGEKRGFFGDETIVYDASHYLVVLSLLPIMCQTMARPGAPVLVFGVEIDLGILRELLADLEPDAYADAPSTPRGAWRAKLGAPLEDAALRFLGHLRDERTARVLGRQTLREILFHVLDGPHGHALRSVAQPQGPTGQLARVMRHIGEHYAEHLAVEDLARRAGMSVPTFHHHFKTMMSTSPLQYVKGIRLARAKQLLQGGSSAKDAARDVGYQSESQFSREFRRYFGMSPSDVASPIL